LSASDRSSSAMARQRTSSTRGLRYRLRRVSVRAARLPKPGIGVGMARSAVTSRTLVSRPRDARRGPRRRGAPRRAIATPPLVSSRPLAPDVVVVALVRVESPREAELAAVTDPQARRARATRRVSRRQRVYFPSGTPPRGRGCLLARLIHSDGSNEGFVIGCLLLSVNVASCNVNVGCVSSPATRCAFTRSGHQPGPTGSRKSG